MERDDDMSITAKAETDIYYLTHRLTYSDIETRKILSKLYTLFNLLDTASLDCRKAIPVYSDCGELVKYNIFKARLPIRRATLL